MKTVYVVGGDDLTCKMFREEGWRVMEEGKVGWDSSAVDLVCFTGGGDVSPELYGEKIDGARGIDKARDEREVKIYDAFKGVVPIVGICRGGQLLNVLNGGRLIQDLGHLYSGLEPLDDLEYSKVLVDHHQGIIPAASADYVIGYMSTLGHNDEHDSLGAVVYYKSTKSLCFQPHPEWGHEGTKNVFFNLIKQHLGE